MKLKAVTPLRNKKSLFRPLTIRVREGEICCLMGPSGIGKSSLLDAIDNSCEYKGHIENNDNIFRVFQDTNQLFPWMTIRKNLKLVADIDWGKISKQIGLDQHIDKYPDQCSVGQKQRFTLLRALHSDRSILLCDEPLSGVDDATGRDIVKEFKKLVKKTNKKVLWVTHNPLEAKQLGKVIKIK